MKPHFAENLLAHPFLDPFDKPLAPFVVIGKEVKTGKAGAEQDGGSLSPIFFYHFSDGPKDFFLVRTKCGQFFGKSGRKNPAHFSKSDDSIHMTHNFLEISQILSLAPPADDPDAAMVPGLHVTQGIVDGVGIGGLGIVPDFHPIGGAQEVQPVGRGQEIPNGGPNGIGGEVEVG
jgi:hypothetical protein